jgi:hypothetical protein
MSPLIEVTRVGGELVSTIDQVFPFEDAVKETLPRATNSKLTLPLLKHDSPPRQRSAISRAAPRERSSSMSRDGKRGGVGHVEAARLRGHCPLEFEDPSPGTRTLVHRCQILPRYPRARGVLTYVRESSPLLIQCNMQLPFRLPRSFFFASR